MSRIAFIGENSIELLVSLKSDEQIVLVPTIAPPGFV